MYLLERVCPKHPISNMPDVWNIQYEGSLLQNNNDKVGMTTNNSTGAIGAVSFQTHHETALWPYVRCDHI